MSKFRLLHSGIGLIVLFASLYALYAADWRIPIGVIGMAWVHNWCHHFREDRE